MIQAKAKNIKLLLLVFNEKVETYEASILAAGDVMVHSPQLQVTNDSTTNSYELLKIILNICKKIY